MGLLEHLEVAGAAPRLGLGCMRLSSAERPCEDEAIRILHRALDLGVRLFDTANVYAPTPGEVGHNERLLARALATWRGDRSQVVVATKVGLVRRGAEWLSDGRGRSLRHACEASRLALGVETLDLLQLHAPDPRVPLVTSLRALARLQSEGRIRGIGLSNVRLDQLEQAREVVEPASVQVALHPFDSSAIKNGVLEYCSRHGIPLLAHSPLGGPRGARRLERHAALAELAARHAATPEEVALAWLLDLDPVVVPLPGATRLESVESSVRAAKLQLAAEDLAQLETIFHPGPRALPMPRRSGAPSPPSAPDSAEVVLLMGYPGAGKSTASQAFTEQGYVRLSRDRQGGRLADLLPEIDRQLAAGTRRLVLDNTYPSRASRFDVIQTASRHGARVRCVWLDTSIEDAQVNAVRRMVGRYGRLLEPEEIRTMSRKDPNTFAPNAQFRYRRQLEEPRIDEGFSSVERLEFERDDWHAVGGRALFFEVDGVIRRTRSGAPYPSDPDDVELLPGRRESLARFAGDGYRLLGVSYQPGIAEGRLSEPAVHACNERTRALLGLDLEVAFCPHGGGPPVCWCRKPLPGLGVLFIERHRLDPAHCIVIASSAADRGFAQRLACRVLEVETVFPL